VIMLIAARVGWAAPATGFDHSVHARDVDVSGANQIACARCHDQKAGRLVGRPNHTACFGACHGPAPTRATKPDEQHQKVCANCHADTNGAVAFPPYRIDRDFGILLGHKQHGDVACTQCHDPIAHKPIAPHVRCIGCHDGRKTFAIEDCLSCHPRAIGKPQPPELAPVKNSVTSIFSHATHAARGGAGRDCTTCHAKVRDANEQQIQLPRPTANDCAHCHDGVQAFSVVVACTRCHAEPKDPFSVVRPQQRFSHAIHADKTAAPKACLTCHVLEKSGEIAIAGHLTCTGEGCHTDDFGARAPTKCGACHSSTEPWRKLRADRELPEQTEFGASLDHAKHGAACATCHSLKTAAAELRTPRGHVSCVGSGCHAATTGPAPHLGDCTACHQLGLIAQRIAKSTGKQWSVRLAFDHAPHEKDLTGAPLPCRSCHASLDGQLVELATPAKATCAACHTGERAFKLTGTTCRRCHTGSK
jgi:c(7)-type cytochrome triheme protein